MLKRSRGIGCGYISGKPMPKYQCTAKPSGAIVLPDGVSDRLRAVVALLMQALCPLSPFRHKKSLSFL